MTISAWYLLLLSIPVLLLGEQLVKRIEILSRFNIPAPVVGGLVLSLLLLLLNALDIYAIQFGARVSDAWWTWLVSTEWEWMKRPEKNVNLPFLVGFFTCIGLNASWDIAKRGSFQVLVFLTLAAGLAVVQNVIGLAMAGALGISPLLGLMCGSVSMTGGHGTSMGFAGVFEQAGLDGAMAIGMAAATFGLVMGGLVGGPVGGGLIRKWKLQPNAPEVVRIETASIQQVGILSDLRALASHGSRFFVHLLLLLACIKLGTYVSHLFQKANLTFPVYLGAMLLGVAVRNIVDLSGKRWIRTEIVDTLSSVTLGIFLAMAMMSLNLLDLKNTALPMLLILFVQVGFVALFAWFITHRVMGRDFDAAVMAGGHCGFALGATPNAVANMKVLVERFGPAPRAFLVLPIVGAFLIDFPNALVITFFLNLVK